MMSPIRNLKPLSLVLAFTLSFFLAVDKDTLAHAQTAAPVFPKLKPSDPLPSGLFVDLAKAVNPSVVNIFTTYLRNGRGQRPQDDPFFELFEQFMGPGARIPRAPQQSLGTGFIIREDGLIVTNNHVIDKADVIKVQLDENTKESFDAKVVGKDAKSDIALIKIEAKRKLPFVRLGSSADVQVGEWVAAFGNPYGYGHTVTKGIISAIGREIDELNLFPFMQTDASINPGNSGGPLVNTQGLVIGVNTAIDARAQGIGFVIPIDNVKTILPMLEKDGQIQRGFLGIEMGMIDREGADTLEMSQAEGVLILNVIANTSAQKAGLEPYDLIVEVEGKKISSPRDLTRVLSATPVGSKMTVKVLRNGKPLVLPVTLNTAPSELTLARGGRRELGRQAADRNLVNVLGMNLLDYSPRLAQEFGLPQLAKPRPIVVSVDRDSPAAKKGLAPGDVILDLNRKEMSRAKDVAKSVKKNTLNIFRVLKHDRVVLISLSA